MSYDPISLEAIYLLARSHPSPCSHPYWNTSSLMSLSSRMSLLSLNVSIVSNISFVPINAPATPPSFSCTPVPAPSPAVRLPGDVPQLLRDRR